MFGLGAPEFILILAILLLCIPLGWVIGALLFRWTPLGAVYRDQFGRAPGRLVTTILGIIAGLAFALVVQAIAG